MPIVFQQPSPMAPDIVSAAGAAEQWSKDAPMLARMYESAQSGQTQASIASAHNATQMNAAQLSESGRDSTSANMLQEHARQFDQSRMPSRADVFHAQAQQQAQQQRAELGAWLQQQDLSQAEGMRLQRLQGAVGHVMADETLDPETKQNLLMQLKTNIDPMQKRVEMAKAKLEMSQAARIDDIQAKEETRRIAGDAHWAKHAKGGFLSTDPNGIPVGDDYTGERRLFVRDHNGDTRELAPHKSGDHPQSEEAMIERLTKFEQHAMDMGIKQQKADMDAWDKKRQATIDAGKEDPGSMPGSKDVGSYMQYYLDRMPGYSDLRAKLENRGKTQQPGATNPPPAANPQGGMGQAPPTAPTAPQAGPPSVRPFDWTGKDQSRPMNPMQQQWIGQLSTARSEIGKRTDLSERDRWGAEDALTDMKELLGRWGAEQLMPDSEKEKYEAAKKVVAAIPTPKKPVVGTFNNNMMSTGGVPY